MAVEHNAQGNGGGKPPFWLIGLVAGAALATFAAMHYFEWPSFPKDEPAPVVAGEDAADEPLLHPLDVQAILRQWEEAHPLPKLQDPLEQMNRPPAAAPRPMAATAPGAADAAAYLMRSWLSPTLDGKRVVVAIDMSSPIKRKLEAQGADMAALATEVGDLLGGLTPTTEVALLQFSRSYAWAQPQMVPLQTGLPGLNTWLSDGLVKSGRAGRDWQRGSPDGIQGVLDVVWALQPDAVVVISDASFQYTTEKGGGRSVPWEALTEDVGRWQARNPQPVALYGLCVDAKEDDLAAFNVLAQQHGGWARAWTPVASLATTPEPAASR
ncbi:MAG: hypothetical protein Q7P63_11430 [Verrucomicrobiota bacterium JB022]|nr:hypothetical protein [Verrucomicrobiota bacterium JB022]